MASKIIKSIGAVALTCACALVLVACDSTSKDGLTGGVAATVNGVDISEDKITTHIQTSREVAGLDNEDGWGEWLATNSYTPEKYREEVIDYYVEQELVKQQAEKAGINVSENATSIVDNMKANYNDDEAWKKALENAGYTEESYHDMVVTSLQIEDLLETEIPAKELTDEEVVESLKMYATSYDGSKRSSHILFNADDEATANEVLTKIKNGELDFAEAAKTYSQDTGSAEKGGDVGWDALAQFVTEYTTALEGLEKDQVSDLVTSEFGIHIIKVTDVFNAPEEITSKDQVPAEIVEVVESNLTSSNDQQSYSEWYDKIKEEAEININPMPEKVPYNLDISKYEKAAEEKAATDGAATEETPTDEAATEITEEELNALMNNSEGEGSSEEEIAPSEDNNQAE